MPDHDARDERGEFKSRSQFLFTVIGLTLGNGNFWHFPLAVKQFGGASFLVMYSICMVIYGVPMLYLEMMIGQIAQIGPMRAFQLNFPLLQGVGWSVCVLSFLRAINIALLNSFSLLYAFESLIGVETRTVCTNEFNSEACFSPKTNRLKRKNTTVSFTNTTNKELKELYLKKTPPGIEFPAREYFRETLRGLPASFTEGIMNHNESEFYFGSGRLIGSFCIVWFIACFILLRRVRWLGKVFRFIVIFAGFLSFVFLIKAFTMNHSDVALQRFFKFNGTQFGEIKAWHEASRMSAVSLCLGMGGMISMSSYNKRGNDAF
ncbi:hypothetical protein PMAYCL1PPCAC_08161, partial [Pristionchus mayeri]